MRSVSTTAPANPLTVLARIDGRCPACGEAIEEGTPIVLTRDGRWVHGGEEDLCREEYEGE